MTPKILAQVIDARNVWEESPGTIGVGNIVKIDEQARPWVDFPGNQQGPILARVVSLAASIDIQALESGAKLPVLLVFENNDPSLPVVLGALRDRLELDRKAAGLLEKPNEAIVDGKRVVLQADLEVVLRCGKCSITLNHEGKISIRGQYVINQAVRANRIKGGSVEIN